MESTQKSQYGRMFPVRLVPMSEKTSGLSSKNSAKLKEVTPLFLDLRNGGGDLLGTMQDLSWQTSFQSLGESSMLNFGEYPNAVEESSLWSIFEDNVPEKYSLSEKACQGVLRRADRRGKALPILLRVALMQKCGMPVEMAMARLVPLSQETTKTE